MDIIISIVLAIILIFATIKKKAFTPTAAISAGVILLTAAICASYAGIFIVITAYSVIFAVDLAIGRKTAKISSQINQKQGARDIVQVLANALAATIALVIGKILVNDMFTVVYAIALTECLADSLASDIGVLSKKDPIDICRFRRVKRGLSGGVSLLGTLSAFLGCLFMSIFTIIFFGFDLKIFLSVLLIPMLGVFTDSVLGSLVQVKYTCSVCQKPTEKKQHCGEACLHTGGLKLINNDAVNIISNFLTAAVAVIILI